MNFDNFHIRLLTADDGQEFYNLIDRNRSRLEAFFSGTVSKTRNLEDTKEYLVEITNKIQQRIYLPFLVINTDNNSLAGFLDIKNIDWNIPKGELGCFIDKDYVNEGVATKALKLFMDHCFENYGFKKLFLRTHESNHSAKKLAESCGFIVEGILRSDYKTTTGELVDLLYYGKLSEE
ncbi:MAG: GNAT family protein [Bacteroidetes bacterium]|nr:GNAT family protein [Bacteroidota bacterium]